MTGYDLIGDVHGHPDPLRALLRKLGYREHGGSYRHPDRQVIFLGDFIDRGPGQRAVLDIVRRMVDAGAAQAVMGNHEYNALAYHAEDPTAPDSYLRPHTEKNRHQHQAFLDEHALGSAELRDTLDWFYQLPLWLGLDGLRVVHAAWRPVSMQTLATLLTPDRRLDDSALIKTSRSGTAAFEALEELLKGVEISLPEGASYHDKDGHERRLARLKWWLDPRLHAFQDLVFGPDQLKAKLAAHTPPAELSTGYAHDGPPVFVGHYWLSGTPAPLTRNVACLDYSVAAGGKLVAYRWDGEPQLSADNFFWVEPGA